VGINALVVVAAVAACRAAGCPAAKRHAAEVGAAGTGFVSRALYPDVRTRNGTKPMFPALLIPLDGLPNRMSRFRQTNGWCDVPFWQPQQGGRDILAGAGYEQVASMAGRMASDRSGYPQSRRTSGITRSTGRFYRAF
jgi:hypothetical protein